MLRSALQTLVQAKKENFTFAIKFFGSGMWLFRGDHKPTNEALPTSQSSENKDEES